jgi:hypothetical protein
VEEMNDVNGIRVIPNPNTGSFQVISAEKMQTIEIMDSSGRTILKKDGGFQTSIPINIEVENGNYLIKVTTPAGVSVVKFLVD